jgi:hypothetical protein
VGDLAWLDLIAHLYLNMTDILSFIRQNFKIEDSNILMFDVPAGRFSEYNLLYGTDFQGIDGVCRIRIAVNEFIRLYLDVFRDITDKNSTFDIYTKLLYYDERKGIGNAPFFRYKIFESIRARGKVRLLGQKPSGELPVSGHQVHKFMPGLR